MKIPEYKLINGDCLEILKGYPDNFFDLIVTSPPYADSRKNTYGGIHPNKYVDWFLPRGEQFLRVLKESGTFILNIKEKVADGERHTYILNLIIEMRKLGWLWTEEFIWHKKNCHPGKWPNRFRDAWERCLQFNKSKQFTMYQENVMVPMGDWAKTRLKNLGKNDVRRFNSQVQSGFGKNISNWIGREMAYPSNVLHLATETSNRNHSATFPKALPEWFIKLFSKEDDWILDPFVGVGTTSQVAYIMGRNSIGIDLSKEYIKIALKNIKNNDIPLFEVK
jgi:DNA modification methylase